VRSFLSLALVALSPAACAGSSSAPIAPTQDVASRLLPHVRQKGNPPLSWVSLKAGVTDPGGLAGIVAGPDKNVWYANTQNATLSQVLMDGTANKFPLQAKVGSQLVNVDPGYLTVGADKQFYSGACASAQTPCNTYYVASITTAATVTLHAIPSGDTVGTDNGLALGPDGNVWFAEAGHIAKITPAGVVTEYAYPSGESANANAGVAAGSDGRVWFTEFDAQKIGAVDPASGVVSEFDVHLIGCTHPFGMTRPASDGFMYYGCTSKALGIVASNGGVGTINNPLAMAVDPQSLTVGPDGNVWLAAGRELGFYDTHRQILDAFTPPRTQNFVSLAPAPDRNLWLLSTRGSVDVYVRDVLSVQPKNVSLPGPGESQTLYVTYTGRGKLTAVSSAPGRFSVAPGSQPKTFVVMQIGFGSARITVSDGLGNEFFVHVFGS
jgi:streptogramin lyase